MDDEIKIKIEFYKDDYIRFLVNGSSRRWKVFLNDGRWLCECSVNYCRDINSNCKHIEACKELLQTTKLHILVSKSVRVENGVYLYKLSCLCGFSVSAYNLESGDILFRDHISRKKDL